MSAERRPRVPCLGATAMFFQERGDPDQPQHGLNFTVYGTPTPQAGTRAVNTARGARQISTGGKGLQDWRSAVAVAAATTGAYFDEPVIVQVHFRFAMPASRSKRMRDGECWPKPTKPDLDKLLRALGDGMVSGGLLRDDALIIGWNATKSEIFGGWTGAEVAISTIQAGERS